MSARLPLISDQSRAQTIWKSILDQLLAKPLSNNQMLTGISLIMGDNVINHRLGRQMQGWIISDIDSSISIYRSAPFNDLTLTLNSSGSGVINLVVF